MSQLTLYNAETAVKAQPLPQSLAIEWRGWPHAGRGPTGLGRLRLSHIGSPVRLFRCQIKFLTVRSLIRAWAVMACAFQDAIGERRTGEIDRPLIEAQRLLQEA